MALLAEIKLKSQQFASDFMNGPSFKSAVFKVTKPLLYHFLVGLTDYQPAQVNKMKKIEMVQALEKKLPEIHKVFIPNVKMKDEE